MTISEKAQKLRRMGHTVLDRDWSRPALGTVGLIVDGEGLDQRFLDQLVGGASFEEVLRDRDRWLEFVTRERGQ